MANLNLSEFTEKLFVADADHTFIWDSAASISKRVSRNSWLNSGTLTSDAPVTISQTWNNAAVVFTGLRFNAAGTSDANSAAASKLLDLQIGGVSKFSVDKYGITTSFGAFRQTPTGAGINVSANGNRLALLSNNSTVAYLDGVNFVFDASAILAWSSGSASSGTFDTALVRDSASGNTLALRNGAAAQTFNVYGTSSASNANYARLALTCGLDGNATISTQALGTGTAGTVSINGVPVGLGKGNVSSNVAVGTQALNANTTGLQNTAIGISSLIANTSGQFNTTIGAYSMEFATIGNRNASFGASALLYNTTGNNNLAIGFESGRVIADGVTPAGSCNNSLFIGANTKPLNVSQTNQIVIGYNAIGIGSDSVVLGNDSITKTALKGNVGIGTTSPTSKLDVNGNARFLGDGQFGTSSYIYWGSRSLLSSPIDGVVLLQNQAASDFNRLSFGFNNLNGPALKRVGTELQVVQAGTTAASNFAAGDADLTFIEDRYRRKGAGDPNGTVTAPIGAVYHNTTGGANTSFYVKESSPTPNTGWVGK